MRAQTVLAQLRPALDRLGSNAGERGGFLGSDSLMLAGGLAALIAILFIGAKIKYSRKKKRRNRSRSKSKAPLSNTAPAPASVGKRRSGASGKSRHARRNPTLAETGGLPPPRSEAQNSPSPES